MWKILIRIAPLVIWIHCISSQSEYSVYLFVRIFCPVCLFFNLWPTCQINAKFVRGFLTQEQYWKPSNTKEKDKKRHAGVFIEIPLHVMNALSSLWTSDNRGLYAVGDSLHYCYFARRLRTVVLKSNRTIKASKVLPNWCDLYSKIHKLQRLIWLVLITSLGRTLNVLCETGA